jgi:hypothetical protein
MVTSTFAHPYGTQVFALWLSFVPVIAVMAMMVFAFLRGDRGFRQKARIRVPVPKI